MKVAKNQLRIGTVLNYVNLIVGNLIPIFYTPIMLSLLGQSEYGLYKLASNITSYLGLIAFGIGSAIVRYLVKAEAEGGKEEQERVFALFLVIYQIIAIVALIVGIAISFSLPYVYSNSLTNDELSRMKILVILLVINAAINFSATPYVGIVNCHERFVFLQIMNIISTCLGPLLNLVALFLGFASIGMVASTLIITIAIRISYIIYVNKGINVKPIFKNMPTYLVKSILFFSFWLFLGEVIGLINNSTDTLLIAGVATLGTIGVAIYNVGYVFNNIVVQLTVGVAGLIAPKTNKLVFSGASSTEITDLAIKFGRMQTYIVSLLVAGFIAFGQPFIHFYTGDEYGDAYWVAICTMIPNMIPLIQTVCVNVIIAQNKHKFRSLVYLMIALVNVVGTYFIIRTPLGIIGAALITGIAVFIGQGIIMNIYYWKKTEIQIIRFWKEIIKIYLIPIVLCIISLFISNFVDFYNIFYFAAGILVFLILYCVLSWKLVMNDYEKDIFRGIIDKVRPKKKENNC